MRKFVYFDVERFSSLLDGNRFVWRVLTVLRKDVTTQTTEDVICKVMPNWFFKDSNESLRERNLSLWLTSKTINLTPAVDLLLHRSVLSMMIWGSSDTHDESVINESDVDRLVIEWQSDLLLLTHISMKEHVNNTLDLLVSSPDLCVTFDCDFSFRRDYTLWLYIWLARLNDKLAVFSLTF